MYLASVLHQSAHLSFGRETAQYQQLLTLMAAVSIIIWGLVLLTIMLRLGWLTWQRRRYQMTVSRDNLVSS